MKIIKENRLCCTCTECSSVLEYTISDITHDLRTDVAYVICPVCDNMMEESKVRRILEPSKKEV